MLRLCQMILDNPLAHINIEAVAVLGNGLKSTSGVGIFNDGSERTIVEILFHLKSKEIALSLERMP